VAHTCSSIGAMLVRRRPACFVGAAPVTTVFYHRHQPHSSRHSRRHDDAVTSPRRWSS